MAQLWKADEVEYLKDKVGNVKLSTIAENLGRSYTSVILKLKRLGYSNTKIQTGLITIHELARILGIDRKTVEMWVERHNLSCRKRITRNERYFYLISPTDFWDWAKNNKDKVQFKDIEENVLAPEPSWVKSERRKEIELSLSKKRKYKKWTTLEDRKLLELRIEGLTYKEIGRVLERSAISVEKRYKRLSNQ